MDYHKKRGSGFWLVFILLCMIVGLVGYIAYDSKKELVTTSKETLSWLAIEYKKASELNAKLSEESEYLMKYSFQRVMKTLVSKCIQKNVPVSVALTIIMIESNFDPHAISETDDHGLFQLNLKSWKDELEIDEARIYEPEYNIELGLEVLKRCREKAGNWFLAVGMYNRGNNYQYSNHPEKLRNSPFN